MKIRSLNILLFLISLGFLNAKEKSTYNKNGIFVDLNLGIGNASGLLSTRFGSHKLNNVEEFNIYPNPAINQVSIEINHWTVDDQYMFKLMDVTGKELKTTILSSSHSNYDLSVLNPGVYYLTIFKILKVLKFIN